ncbi:MAG: hypothetical protein DCC52_14165 [Chloroflexi bacterium]|nr:MAG: hypothetical protein DCC52_14165 [Chloroflexota bacterium]
MYYDALLHTIFVGFVFGMIFAHAPIILPSILMRPLPYAPIQYVALLLLQVGLILRVAGDLMLDLTMRQWGGMLNAIAITLYFAVTLFLLVRLSIRQARAAQAAQR